VVIAGVCVVIVTLLSNYAPRRKPPTRPKTANEQQTHTTKRTPPSLCCLTGKTLCMRTVKAGRGILIRTVETNGLKNYNGRNQS